jgi:phosphate starvation-inducible membrane PsiE
MIAAYSIALVAVLAIVSLFQIALILGAPMGEYAFGGQVKGKLPIKMRIGSVISLGLYFAQIGHYLAQAGVLTKFFDTQVNSVVNWVFVGIAALALLMNSISRSEKERKLWVPVALLLLVLTVLVALG